MKTHYDLIVVGGGFAGVAAALAAAEQGVEVLLIERHNCLGGAACHGLVMPFMPYFTRDPAKDRVIPLCGSLFVEIVRRMNALLGRPDNPFDQLFDEEALKLILNRLCVERGVTLLYHTAVIASAVKDGRVTALTAMCKGVALTLTADAFIDATGDAELSVLAGCETRLGRASDSLCQPMTLCFRMSGVDPDGFRTIRALINPLYKEKKAAGLIRNPREDVLIFDNFNSGVLHFNTTRVVRRSPVDPFDLTAAELEAREQVFEILAFLKAHFECFKNARILSTALQIGIRESRKVVGEYTLTVEDLKRLARFSDGIAVANYDIDIHNPEGAGTSHYYFGPGEWYEIPYRCLVPRGMRNLLVAGRCISSTHEAQASFRIMPFCSELGEAAGVAVSVAKATGRDTAGVDVEAVRELLRGRGIRV